jgi:uncharacterized protein (DUF2147 family)
MKTITLIALWGLLVSSIPTESPNIAGTWQAVRAQYGNDPMQEIKDKTILKTFTGTRWSAAWYSRDKKVFEGAGGGTYLLKGNQYTETVEYYSWDAPTVGKTFTFTMSIENGMLHQSGFIEYRDNKRYIIDEWYKKID